MVNYPNRSVQCEFGSFGANYPRLTEASTSPFFPTSEPWTSPSKVPSIRFNDNVQIYDRLSANLRLNVQNLLARLSQSTRAKNTPIEESKPIMPILYFVATLVAALITSLYLYWRLFISPRITLYVPPFKVPFQLPTFRVPFQLEV
jgi:hypothetical protein